MRVSWAGSVTSENSARSACITVSAIVAPCTGGVQPRRGCHETPQAPARASRFSVLLLGAVGATMAPLHGRSTMTIYEQGLDKTAANFVALSPTSFVERSAEVFGDLEAVVHGARRYTGRETHDLGDRLPAALRSLGIGRGATVSVMLHNTPEMVEAHYAVPALNAVLNTLNTRLDAALLAWQLGHFE